MTALRPVTHRLIGSPAQVANVLRAAHTRGRLVACGEPEPLSGHRVAITITVLEPASPARCASRAADTGLGNTTRGGSRRATRRTGPRPARRWLRHAAIVAGALIAAAALAGLLWLLALAVRWVHNHWAELGCLAILAALVYAAAQENHR